MTGAAGFIGRSLSSRLRNAGNEVIGADLHPPSRPAVPFHHLDVTDGAAVRELLLTTRPDRVIHAAALVDDRGDPKDFRAVNVEGTQAVFEASKDAGVQRFVHISSIAALGTNPGPRADERSPLLLRAGNPYFDTKAASEQWVRARSRELELPLVVIRPGDVYGPGSVPWVDRPVELMTRGVPVLVGGGRGFVAHCHVENLVDGIVAALESDRSPGSVLTFTDGERTSYGAYFEALRVAAGVKRPLRSIPRRAALVMAAAFEAGGRIARRPPPLTVAAVRYVSRQTHYSIEAAEETVGYRPRLSLVGGMAKLRRHFAETRGQATAGPNPIGSEPDDPGAER
ncbi:MAG: NAD-dependent epimerase/dehydratase family protein [Myxococcota bacterium]